jgi:hypothetical protein
MHVGSCWGCMHATRDATSHDAAHPHGAESGMAQAPSYTQLRTTPRSHNTGIRSVVQAPAALYAPCKLLPNDRLPSSQPGAWPSAR